jgi:hypothetical protein
MFDRPTRHAYSVKNLARQVHANLARVRLFLRGALDAERTRDYPGRCAQPALRAAVSQDLEQAP